MNMLRINFFVVLFFMQVFSLVGMELVKPSAITTAQDVEAKFGSTIELIAKRTKGLKLIIYADAHITAEDLQALLVLLSEQLYSLQISGNAGCLDGLIDYLYSLPNDGCTLTSLYLEGTGATAEQIIKILCKTPDLCSIGLPGNVDAVQGLATVFDKNMLRWDCKLQKIIINDCDVSAEAVYSILKQCQYIKELNIQGSKNSIRGFINALEKGFGLIMRRIDIREGDATNVELNRIRGLLFGLIRIYIN